MMKDMESNSRCDVTIESVITVWDDPERGSILQNIMPYVTWAGSTELFYRQKNLNSIFLFDSNVTISFKLSE